MIEKRYNKILYCITNLLIFFTGFVVNQFDYSEVQLIDIKVIVSVFSYCVIYAVLFAYTSKNLDHEIFLEAKGFFELKQY